MLLNDLIKDDLIPGAARQGNIGRKPIHAYDCRAYRRALQLIRMMAAGITGRDSQRVQLFLREYGLKLSDVDVRIPLLNEYRRTAKGVFSKVRSGYLDKSRPIPPKRMESLVRQLGTPDNRLEAAKLSPTYETVIELIRAAKLGVLSRPSLQTMKRQFVEQYRNNPSVETLAQLLKPLFIGMLVFDSEADDASSSNDIDTVEKLILGSSEEIYLERGSCSEKCGRLYFV